jgi:hypothetical protein
MMSNLKVFLLGPSHVELAGNPVEIKQRKTLALLASAFFAQRFEGAHRPHGLTRGLQCVAPCDPDHGVTPVRPRNCRDRAMNLSCQSRHRGIHRSVPQQVHQSIGAVRAHCVSRLRTAQRRSAPYHL